MVKAHACLEPDTPDKPRTSLYVATAHVASQLQGTRVKVSFAQPPDTDTPGFVEENKSKVREPALARVRGGASVCVGVQGLCPSSCTRSLFTGVLLLL